MGCDGVPALALVAEGELDGVLDVVRIRRGAFVDPPTCEDVRADVRADVRVALLAGDENLGHVPAHDTGTDHPLAHVGCLVPVGIAFNLRFWSCSRSVCCASAGFKPANY